MPSERQGAKRRAPKLPSHLSFQPAPTRESVSSSECRSLQSSPDRSKLAYNSMTESVKALSIDEQTRVTRSPLMHSAITQGAVPSNRVRKGNHSAGGIVSIQSVLGLPGYSSGRMHLNSTKRDSCGSWRETCSLSTSAPWRGTGDPQRELSTSSSARKIPAEISKAVKFQHGIVSNRVSSSPTSPTFSSCHSCTGTSCMFETFPDVESR